MEPAQKCASPQFSTGHIIITGLTLIYEDTYCKIKHFSQRLVRKSIFIGSELIAIVSGPRKHEGVKILNLRAPNVDVFELWGPAASARGEQKSVAGRKFLLLSAKKKKIGWLSMMEADDEQPTTIYRVIYVNLIILMSHAPLIYIKNILIRASALFISSCCPDVISYGYLQCLIHFKLSGGRNAKRVFLKGFARNEKMTLIVARIFKTAKGHF